MTQIVSERIWATIILCGLGTIFANVIGMIEGVMAGWRRVRPFDVATTDTSMVMYAMPTFWQCLLAIMLFSVDLGWFPVGRKYTPLQHFHMWGPIPLDWLTFKTLIYHITLPVTMFALGYYGEYHLIMRSSLTGVMREDYVLTAQAKGLSDSSVLWRHVVPNALLPTVTLVHDEPGIHRVGHDPRRDGVQLARHGAALLQSLAAHDYPVMQAVFLLGSVAVIFANLIADILHVLHRPAGEGLMPARLKRVDPRLDAGGLARARAIRYPKNVPIQRGFVKRSCAASSRRPWATSPPFILLGVA